MRRQCRGLTLIELMTVVALVATISAFAAPGMQGFVAGQRVKAMATDLASDLVLARSEALKRQRNVTVTPVASGWPGGWTVASEGEVLSRREPTNADLSVSGAPEAVTFNLHGRVLSPSGAVRIGIEAAAASASRRCVELDASGRARARQGACA